MHESKVVTPRYLEGCNIPIWNNIFGAKIHYNCGHCGVSQSTRVPLTDYPVVGCKHCGTSNKLPLITTDSEEEYEVVRIFDTLPTEPQPIRFCKDVDLWC